MLKITTKFNFNPKILRLFIIPTILFATPLIAWSDFLLKYSFKNILGEKKFKNHPNFDLESLRKRLSEISLDNISSKLPNI